MSSPSALKELASALVWPTWIQSQSRRLWLGHASTSWQQLLGATRTSFYLLPRDASAPMKLEGEVASKAQLRDSRSSGFGSKVTPPVTSHWHSTAAKRKATTTLRKFFVSARVAPLLVVTRPGSTCMPAALRKRAASV